MILLTGGSGLVGSFLLEKLIDSGKQVRAIYNKTPISQKASPNLQQVQCNILDVVTLEKVMEGVDEVYNCAGFVSFSPKFKEQLYKVNVEGTANVVNAALGAGVRKMVHISSVAALGRIREDVMIDETMKWTEETSNSLYGHSKFLGEMEVWRGMAEGLDAAIVNPSIIVGPANWNESSTKIFKTVYDGLDWYTNGSTGYVDVRDVADAMITLMESNTSAEKFVLSGHNVSYRQMMNLVADAFGKKHPSKELRPGIAKIYWRFEALKSFFTGADPLITEETTRTALAKVKFDNKKFLAAFPNFKYRPFEDTIEWTAKGLQQKLNMQ